MKYLKRFEANRELFGPKLITANAKAHLPYLEDNGHFDIGASFYGKGQVILQIDSDEIRNWGDYKDEVLSYLEYLGNSYNIFEITMNKVSIQWNGRSGLMEDVITFDELESINNVGFNGLYIILEQK